MAIWIPIECLHLGKMSFIFIPFKEEKAGEGKWSTVKRKSREKEGIRKLVGNDAKPRVAKESPDYFNCAFKKRAKPPKRKLEECAALLCCCAVHPQIKKHKCKKEMKVSERWLSSKNDCRQDPV